MTTTSRVSLYESRFSGTSDHPAYIDVELATYTRLRPTSAKK
ncbi:MAG: hypothetical protein R3B67_05445 [Phycisphaerales bacterium]